MTTQPPLEGAIQRIIRLLVIIGGWWHYLWGFCPECDSSAPYLYRCPVCRFNKVPKELWWSIFISLHTNGKYKKNS